MLEKIAFRSIHFMKLHDSQDVAQKVADQAVAGSLQDRAPVQPIESNEPVDVFLPETLVNMEQRFNTRITLTFQKHFGKKAIFHTQLSSSCVSLLCQTWPFQLVVQDLLNVIELLMPRPPSGPGQVPDINGFQHSLNLFKSCLSLARLCSGGWEPYPWKRPDCCCVKPHTGVDRICRFKGGTKENYVKMFPRKEHLEHL